jgi:hypothetical protein
MANGSKHRKLIRKVPRGILHLPLICASSFFSFCFSFCEKRVANEIYERLKPVKGQHLSNPIAPQVFSQVPTYANPSVFLQRLADTTALLCPLDSIV